MGDRIAVMNAGRIEQVAPPEEIYHEPNSLFVADFIGSPAINFFEGRFDGERVELDAFSKSLPAPVAEALRDGLGGEDVVIGIRPEDLGVTEAGTGLFDTEVEVIEPMGDRKIVYVDAAGRRVEAVVSSDATVEAHDTVGIQVNWPNVHFFSPDGPRVLKWSHVADPAAEAAADGTRQFATGSTDASATDREGEGVR